MKKWLIFFGIVFSACVWREPSDDVCSHEQSVEAEREITVAIRSGSSYWNIAMLSDEALSACDVWNKVGIACEPADSEDSADILIGFYTDRGCAAAGFVGWLGDDYGIWINDWSSCRPDSELSPWFTHALAHEFGHLFGVGDVPVFCGAGIMNPAIERYEPTVLLSAITESDVNAFGERYRSAFLDGDAVLDCGEDKPAEIPVSNSTPCVGRISVAAEVLSLYLEPAVLPWEEEVKEGCSYWTPVNVSCVSVETPEDANVLIRAFPAEEGCGVAGFAYLDVNGKYVFELNVACLPDDAIRAANKVRRVSAHELGHTLGIIHVPEFCGEAVMNPFLNLRTCLSGADVSAWRERYVP